MTSVSDAVGPAPSVRLVFNALLAMRGPSRRAREARALRHCFYARQIFLALRVRSLSLAVSNALAKDPRPEGVAMTRGGFGLATPRSWNA
jgi:hypothetical protein